MRYRAVEAPPVDRRSERVAETWTVDDCWVVQHETVTDDDADGRVTDPDRYAPLHQAALYLALRLLTEYQSDVVHNGDTDDLPAKLTVGSRLRICPANEGYGTTRTRQSHGLRGSVDPMRLDTALRALTVVAIDRTI